jgi:hypothetical protein
MSEKPPFDAILLPVPKFEIGRLVATPNALGVLTFDDIVACLSRHVVGDWGTMDPHDLHANNQALALGGRLFSAYDSAGGERFWIITEADRSATTILLPEDY